MTAREIRAKNGGWSLQAYHWEHQTFPNFQTVKVERKNVQKMLDKMSEHFGVTPVTLDCLRYKHGNAGHYNPNFGRPYIVLGKEPSLGVICHEFSHHYARVKYKTKRWHGEQFKRCLSGVYEYAERYLKK